MTALERHAAVLGQLEAEIDAGLRRLGMDPDHFPADTLERLRGIIFWATELNEQVRKQSCPSPTPGGQAAQKTDCPESVPGRPFYRLEALLSSLERTVQSAREELKNPPLPSPGRVVFEMLQWKALALGLKLPQQYIASLEFARLNSLGETLERLVHGTAGVEIPLWVGEASMRFTRGEEWCPGCSQAWALQDGLCGSCLEKAPALKADTYEWEGEREPGTVYCDLCNEACEDGFQTFEDVPGIYHLGCSPAPGFVPLRLKSQVLLLPLALQGPPEEQAAP